MTTNQTPATYNADLTVALGQAANQAAARSVFSDYLSLKSANTIRAQRADLNSFCDYLHDIGQDSIDCSTLQEDPRAWYGITWGLIEAFKRWQLQRGDSIGSINRRLSTVKTYSKLAARALGATGQENEATRRAAQELQLVSTVTGYSAKEGQNIDDRREQTNHGRKKAENVSITDVQAKRLKTQPDTPQGRRDAVLINLLIDHGMRSSELASLTIDGLDLDRGEITFTRQKVRGTDKHRARQRLTGDAQEAIRAYIDAGDAPSSGQLLRGSRKGGKLSDRTGMSNTSISLRVRDLGHGIGIEGLSAHDMRHYCATYMASNGCGVSVLCDWFGWNSPAMALRYIQAADVAERGIA